MNFLCHITSSATVKDCPDLRNEPFKLGCAGLTGAKTAADIGSQLKLFPPECNPQSTIGYQIRENIEAEKTVRDDEDLAAIRTVDLKARFNDPSADFGYDLYIGLAEKS